MVVTLTEERTQPFFLAKIPGYDCREEWQGQIPGPSFKSSGE